MKPLIAIALLITLPGCSTVGAMMGGKPEASHTEKTMQMAISACVNKTFEVSTSVNTNNVGNSANVNFKCGV